MAVTSALSEGLVTAPDVMTGDDGEVVFVRRDLADTVIGAKAYALEHDGCNVNSMDVDEIEMLPIPAHFTEIDYEWGVVRAGTPDAVAYWRFRL